jgi:hypothetical protein
MAAAGVTADELGAVIGLPNEIAQRDAATIEVLLNAGGEDGAGGSGAALREGPEQQAAAYFAGGVFHSGQIESLSLGPVAGDVVEILGVGGDLLKDAPGGLDVGEVLFALILALALCWRQMRSRARWLSGRSNSRMRRRAPKVNNCWRKATTCSSMAAGVLPG